MKIVEAIVFCPSRHQWPFFLSCQDSSNSDEVGCPSFRFCGIVTACGSFGLYNSYCISDKTHPYTLTLCITSPLRSMYGTLDYIGLRDAACIYFVGTVEHHLTVLKTDSLQLGGLFFQLIPLEISFRTATRRKKRRTRRTRRSRSWAADRSALPGQVWPELMAMRKSMQNIAKSCGS